VPLGALKKNCWTRVLGSVVIQLYAGECTPSVDRALRRILKLENTSINRMRNGNEEIRRRFNLIQTIYSKFIYLNNSKQSESEIDF